MCSVSAAFVILPVSTTRTKVCIALKRSMAYLSLRRLFGFTKQCGAGWPVYPRVWPLYSATYSYPTMCLTDGAVYEHPRCGLFPQASGPVRAQSLFARHSFQWVFVCVGPGGQPGRWLASGGADRASARSEEHTSELQSRGQLVCSLLLE